MTKIYEVITPEVVAEYKFTLTLADGSQLEKVLKFQKLTMKVEATLKQAGIDVFEIFSDSISTSDSMHALLHTVFACMIPESKEEFNNEFDLFANFIGFGEVASFNDIFQKIMAISVPKSENAPA
jgi:hypothetical protein